MRVDKYVRVEKTRAARMKKMNQPATMLYTGMRKRSYGVILVAGILMVLVAAAAVYFLYPRHAVIGLRYIAGSFEERGLYEIGLFGTTEVPLPVQGRVIDYDRSAGGEAVLTVLDSGMQRLYRIADGEPELILETSAITSSIQISQDGGYIAYAQRATAPEDPLNSRGFHEPDAWTVRLYDTVSGAERAVGIGHAPQFFSSTGKQYLLYVTSRDVRIRSLETDAEQALAIGADFVVGTFPPSVSDDGTYIATATAGDTYSLYTLKDIDGIFDVSLQPEFPRQTRAIAFGNNAVFSVSRTSATAAVVVSFASGNTPWNMRPALTLSPILVTRLIP